MAALGVGLLYLGYCGGLWGVLLIAGKNVGFRELFGATWPPDVPGATGTASSAASAATSGSAGAATGTGESRTSQQAALGNT
jgi:hypothetical protein